MNRQQIIDTCACPSCKAPAGEACFGKGGKPRKKNHLARVYRAQDITNGAIDRLTGEDHGPKKQKRRAEKHNDDFDVFEDF